MECITKILLWMIWMKEVLTTQTSKISQGKKATFAIQSQSINILMLIQMQIILMKRSKIQTIMDHFTLSHPQIKHFLRRIHSQTPLITLLNQSQVAKSQNPDPIIHITSLMVFLKVLLKKRCRKHRANATISCSKDKQT